MCRFYSKSTLTYILSFNLLHYPMRWELSFSAFYRWRNRVSQRLSNLPQIIQVIRKGPKKSSSKVCSLHSHCKVKLKSPGVHAGVGACAEGCVWRAESGWGAALRGRVPVWGAQTGPGCGRGHACLVDWRPSLRSQPSHPLLNYVPSAVLFSFVFMIFQPLVLPWKLLHILNVSQLNIITRKRYSI